MRKLISLILIAASLSTAAYATNGNEPKWQSLFNGKNLKGWTTKGGKAKFHVEKGMIVGDMSKGGENYNTFLCTEKEYGNFNLEFEFRAEEMNSGVQFRGIFEDGLVKGMQYEIDPEVKATYTSYPANKDKNGEAIAPGKEIRSWTGGIYDEKRRLWIGDLTENPEARAAYRPGEWNKGRIEAHQGSIRTYINGVLASSIVDYATPNGFIGLQAHWGKEYKDLHVWFKNIRIQDFGLNPEDSGDAIDLNINEWYDTKTGWLAQSYKDLATGEYRMNLSSTPYANKEPDHILKGSMVNGTIVWANEEGLRGSISKNNLKIEGNGFKFAGLTTNRKSPTINMGAPEDAEILFDGKDLSKWGSVAHKEWYKWSKEASESVKLTPSGSIQIIPDQGSLVTKKTYGDIQQLHIEFRLLGKKTNGGVYMQSRYELNIKDSWGIGKGASTGAFGNIPGAEDPEFNYALPPFIWQTLDISYKAPKFDASGAKTANARITVRLNGKLIYEDFELKGIKGAGGGKTPLGPTGPIYLQEHGTEYEFRNIWVR